MAILLSVAGVVFAASFAVEKLQSWPKALLEARVVLCGQIMLGVSIGLASWRWQKWIHRAILGMMLVSLVGFSWSLGTSSRFGVCVWGMLLFVWMGGGIFAELGREIFSSSRKLPTIPATDPSLN